MSRITQRGATSGQALIANGAFQTSTNAALATLVGTRWDLSDGREIMLVKAATGTTVAAGKLYQDAAIVANHQNLAVTAYQAFSANGNVPPKVTVTLGATAATANQYAGGFVVVNDNNGEGHTLRIASHPAADASGSLAVTLEEGSSVAITTASEVCLIPPHGKDIIIAPTTITGAIAGVGLCTIAAESYGFVTTKGLTSCLADGAITAGAAISPSNAVAGAVEAGVIAQGLIGNANQAGVDTEYRSVFINV
jgi:hypothetical protein